MKKLKAFGLTTFLLILVFILGILSFKLIKPFLANVGFDQNWAWPAICFGAAILFCRFTATPLKVTGGSVKNILLRLCGGLLAGAFLQVLFWKLGLRRAFEFQGFVFGTLLFQVVVSFCEEIFFRGALQAYLGNRLGRSLVSQILAALLISIPFGLIHGLNPVIFNNSSFDMGWFFGTFALSTLAGIFYALTKKVDTAFGVHLGHNLVSLFF